MRVWLLVVDERSNGEGVNDVACFIYCLLCLFGDSDGDFTLEGLHLARPSKGGG